MLLVPYSQNFSRDPIFTAEELGAKISRSNFRGWTFHNRERLGFLVRRSNLLFQSTAKTEKTGSIDDFQLYVIHTMCFILSGMESNLLKHLSYLYACINILYYMYKDPKRGEEASTIPPNLNSLLASVQQ